ncbi:hypothetical protein [Frigoribacterium sp. CFBP 8751]|uniref:hypothetical protein n=1 Tax=Frigoribacterium sp. CFBP 8751 TaxID=2775277 RepID=UPI00178227B2|nr:hypothetical protein [Frigoribacterium sp. CFBP 8751]MBD8538888.1 hypothetical protein [Frigoribacterium sp. CFBP 8751]
MTGGRAIAVVVAVLVATGGVLSAAAPATAAAAPRLMVSGDGEHWQGRLDSALFGDDLRLVPGASTTGTFWVKNLSSEPAALSARLVDVTTSSPAFAEAVTVSSHSDLDVGDLPPVTLAGDGCTPVLAPVRLAAGQEVPVTVSVALDGSAADGTGDQTLDFGVLVTLTGLAGAAVPAGCASAGTAGAADVGADTDTDTSAGGAGGDRVSSATIEAVTPRASSAGEAGGAASSVGDGGSDGTTDASGTDTELPVHALDVLDDFVPVPLRGSWLPLLIAAIAVLAGAFVAVGRRRPGDEDTAGEQS